MLDRRRDNAPANIKFYSDVLSHICPFHQPCQLEEQRKLEISKSDLYVINNYDLHTNKSTEKYKTPTLSLDSTSSMIVWHDWKG